MLQQFAEKDEIHRVARSAKIDTDEQVDTSTSTRNRQDGVSRRFDQITFIKRLLIGAPQVVGPRRAWDIYNDVKAGGSEYVSKLYGTDFEVPEFADMEEFRQIHRLAVGIIRREEERAKIPKKRKATAENEGYSEPVIEPSIDNWRFTKDNSIKSLVEDVWKADRYVWLCQRLSSRLMQEGSEIQSDDLLSVLKRATEKYLKTQGRPVLTNELADFENPYMMKKSTMERLLHEGCVRNKLEESLVPDVLNSDPELTKLRTQADMPPEILEPLQAFRGMTDWSFDPEIRIEQKLVNLNAFLDQVLGAEKNISEPKLVSLSDGRVSHRFSNHLGFVSAVPQGRRGGWGQGKPDSAEKRDLSKVRYPTLQRVAHALPKDPHYRSQAVHAIQVLERSKGWTFSDKTKAVNALKEVLDTLPSSRMIRGKLDRALPVVRYGRFAPGALSSSHKFVRRKPSNLKRRNRIRMYFRSMTAITPLARRWADRRTKNQQRSKKKDSKR